MEVRKDFVEVRKGFGCGCRGVAIGFCTAGRPGANESTSSVILARRGDRVPGADASCA